MSLQHKAMVRMGDEYVCTHCGKSWDVTDNDPPACDNIPAWTEATRRMKSRNAPEMHNVPAGTIVARGTWSSKAPCQQNLPKARTHRLPEYTDRSDAFGGREITPLDFGPIELRVIATCAVYGAYLITLGDAGTLVYADSENAALAFILRICGGKPPALTPIRMTSMDEYRNGRSPRVEMNPSILSVSRGRCANDGKKYHVLNINEFMKHIGATIKNG